MTGPPDGERRTGDRLSVPMCVTCRTDEHVAVALRTTYAVYFRCSVCGNVISARKHEPQRQPPHVGGDA